MTVTEGQGKSEDYLRFELQQALETVRHQTTLLVQLTGFLIALDSALVAYGFAQGKAIMLLIAAIVPAAMMFAVRLIIGHVYPIAMVALRAESALHDRQDGLVGTYLKFRLPEMYDQLKPLVTAGDDEPVRCTTNPVFLRKLWAGTTRRALSAGFLTQIALFVVAVAVFKMRLF
ncbi:hypothetical protein [Amycolatopsis sp. NPDC059021]|uniref:hypothetical protein n=1 Tax=Amycolatopsis sp. NPDC059021 TaxID=3346704 RepID=UPI00367005A3